VRPAARLSSPTKAARPEFDRSEMSVTTGSPRAASAATASRTAGCSSAIIAMPSQRWPWRRSASASSCGLKLSMNTVRHCTLNGAQCSCE
jgi:hypothetical protein